MIRTLDWVDAIDQKIRIYRNLNNGTMSIQQKIDKSWKVTGHVTACVVKDVRFVISESGRQRVIRDGRKNVHAYGEGILLGEADDDIYAPYSLAYNPYTDASFLDRNSRRSIERCSFLVVRNNLVFVSADALSAGGDRSTPHHLTSLPQLFQFQRFSLAAA